MSAWEATSRADRELRLGRPHARFQGSGAGSEDEAKNRLCMLPFTGLCLSSKSVLVYFCLS